MHRFGGPCWTPLGSGNGTRPPRAAWVAFDLVKASTKKWSGLGRGGSQGTSALMRGAMWDAAVQNPSQGRVGGRTGFKMEPVFLWPTPTWSSVLARDNAVQRGRLGHRTPPRACSVGWPWGPGMAKPGPGPTGAPPSVWPTPTGSSVLGTMRTAKPDCLGPWQAHWACYGPFLDPPTGVQAGSKAPTEKGTRRPVRPTPTAS